MMPKAKNQGAVMKYVGKLLTVVAILASLNALAADPPPRKDAIMDTGEGGMRLKLSAPDFADGPYDFAKNKGPVVNSQPKLNLVSGEAMFDLKVGESAVVLYQATVARRYSIESGADRLTAEVLAQGEIKRAGFVGRAVKIDCPKSSLEGASVACYRMAGEAIVDATALPGKSAHILFAISFGDDKKGYTLMAAIAERDAARFDANPAKYEKIANNALADIWRNHQIELR
jgi:hypothetical protein